MVYLSVKGVITTEKIEILKKAVDNAKKIVFFGGAGVSTESGLPDYRSENGIYNTAKNYGLPPEEILSHELFFNDPGLFYRFYRDYFLTDAEPCKAHKVLAVLETMGKDVSIVTQNIDGLHTKAGNSKVYELHGNAEKLYCTVCRKEYGVECLTDSEDTVPRCSCGGLIKPHVTLYGEMLDDTVVDGAINAIEEADLLIIGGTSLAVYPAASFVRYFRGDTVVIINKSPTPYDDCAELVFHESISDVLGKLI